MQTVTKIPRGGSYIHKGEAEGAIFCACDLLLLYLCARDDNNKHTSCRVHIQFQHALYTSARSRPSTCRARQRSSTDNARGAQLELEEALCKGWVQPQPTTFRQVVRWLAAPDDIRRAAATPRCRSGHRRDDRRTPDGEKNESDRAQTDRRRSAEDGLAECGGCVDCD